MLENILKFKNLRKTILQSRKSVSAEHTSSNNNVMDMFNDGNYKDNSFNSEPITNSGGKPLSPLKRSGLSLSNSQQSLPHQLGPISILPEEAKPFQKEEKELKNDLGHSNHHIQSSTVAENTDIFDSPEFINFVKGLSSRPQSQENEFQRSLSHSSSSFLTSDVAPSTKSASHQLQNDTKNSYINFPYIKTSSSALLLPTVGELSLQGSHVTVLKKPYNVKSSKSQFTDSSSRMSDSDNEES